MNEWYELYLNKTGMGKKRVREGRRSRNVDRQVIRRTYTTMLVIANCEQIQSPND